MPFQKGVISNPNPGGRLKLPAGMRELAKAKTIDAINTLGEIMNDKTAPPSARVTAANSLLDRAWGKPEQSTNITVTSVEFEKMGIDELRLWVAREAKTIEGSLADIEDLGGPGELPKPD
jgi:hypothetical protein